MPNWTFRTHTTKTGQKIYYARSRQPIRDPKTGKVCYRHVERSCGTTSIQTAREFDKEYHEGAYNPQDDPAHSEDVFTFADAVGVYVRSGSPGCVRQRNFNVLKPIDAFSHPRLFDETNASPSTTTSTNSH
jgi:hypothetical protein